MDANCVTPQPAMLILVGGSRAGLRCCLNLDLHDSVADAFPQTSGMVMGCKIRTGFPLDNLKVRLQSWALL